MKDGPSHSPYSEIDVTLTGQIMEAMRFHQRGSVHYERLALLLLDNALEMIMIRYIDRALQFRNTFQHLAKVLDVMHASGKINEEEYQQQFGDISPMLITGRRKRAIDRYFHAKVDYLVERQVVDEVYGETAKRLHNYRNELYHEGRIREHIIQTCVELYLHVVLKMYQEVAPQIKWEFLTDEEWMQRWAPCNLDAPLLNDIRTSGAAHALATHLEVELDSIPRSAADHLHARTNAARDDLAWCSSELLGWGTGPITLDDTFKLAQLNHMGRLTPAMTLADVGAADVPYSLATLDEVETEVLNLPSVDNPLDAFISFNRLEGTLECIEAPIATLVEGIDREIQRQIDEALGK